LFEGSFSNIKHIMVKKATSTLTRSQNMARIRSKNTRPEILLRQALWKQNLRYRIHIKLLDNIHPDIVITKYKLAIFIDGCQWHGCPVHYVKPRTNREFWGEKLKVNINRDITQTYLLTCDGWYVFRVWEHDIWENLTIITSDIKEYIFRNRTKEQNMWRIYQVDEIDKITDKEKCHLCNINSPQSTRIIQRYRSTKKWKRNQILY
jgi:DNA mismatch endonuclease (patch repair protein)